MSSPLITHDAVSRINVKCHPYPIDFSPRHCHLELLERLPASNQLQRKPGLTMPAQYQFLVKTKCCHLSLSKRQCSNDEWEIWRGQDDLCVVISLKQSPAQSCFSVFRISYISSHCLMVFLEVRDANCITRLISTGN